MTIAGVLDDAGEDVVQRVLAMMEARDREWFEAAKSAGICSESMDGQEGPHLGSYGDRCHPGCGCKDLRRLMAESGDVSDL